MALTQIVILSGLRVHPVASGGQLRTVGVASALARLGYRVEIHSLTGRRPDYAAWRPWQSNHQVEQLEPGVCEITYLGLEPAVRHALSQWLGYPRLWMQAMVRAGRLPARLRAALRAADAVIADHAYIPRAPGAPGNPPWYLLSHQLEHRLLEQGPPAMRRRAPDMRVHEAGIPGSFTDVFACTEEDRDFFLAHAAPGTLRAPIVRCGVDPRHYAWTPDLRERTRAELGVASDERVLMFAGSAYAPNLEALADLKAFAREESAFLAEQRVRFLVLGAMERQPYRDGAVIATGRVPEVLPYFAAADAGLNPIVRGAGANVKLFEYMAAGLPVISTVFGVRGSELSPEDYVAFEPGALRAAISRFAAERTAAQWRDHAAGVWARHRASCDIELLVRAALERARDFPPA